MTIRGYPLRHTVAVPQLTTTACTGTSSISGTAVTDTIPLTAEQTASARYYCYGWTLTNDVGTVLGGDGTTQAVFTAGAQTWRLYGTGRTSGTSTPPTRRTAHWSKT